MIGLTLTKKDPSNWHREEPVLVAHFLDRDFSICIVAFPREAFQVSTVGSIPDRDFSIYNIGSVPGWKLIDLYYWLSSFIVFFRLTVGPQIGAFHYVLVVPR